MNKNTVLKVGDVAGSGNGMFLRIEVTPDGNATHLTVMKPALAEGGRVLVRGPMTVILRPDDVAEAMRLLQIASVVAHAAPEHVKKKHPPRSRGHRPSKNRNDK